ncbi:copper-translocating P-type ATPase [Salibacterium salarium]|uniref:P-type Cu(+) transporter n=1 Tax=Salibacterium salarium TaxID=284579 RepID=A0A3R9QRF5_9BACI|nr:heavy metal translocating P-type ATPase [Salibacterium salarium]RSL31771.1 copper-translocating P-type ATPase [Salibacterium salarium]
MEETNHLEIRGMHCAACATRIEKAVSKIEGVTDAHVNVTTEKGYFTYDKKQTGISDIINRINKIGFQADKSTAQPDRAKHREVKALQWNFIVSALLTLPLAWAMLTHFKWSSFLYIPDIFLQPLFQLAITIPIQFVIGFAFYERAWNALKHGSANMDSLVVLSTSTAFFYSHYLTFTSFHTAHDAHSLGLFYETSAFIITFILLGKVLEARTKMKTTEAVKKLHQLQTKTATLYKNGKESSVSVDNILPGDVVVLRPGEKVPVDGQVLKGTSTVDESLLTGESMPVEKNAGNAIYAGTMNKNGLLTVKVTKKRSETTLSHIIRIVEKAQVSKAPIQHIADKITEVFVPIVITTALVTFAVWYMIFQPGYIYGALEKSIAVLIIACPCALGLATPTSVMVGSGRAAQLGLLFKEGRFLELLGRTNIVALDKTGTITKGEPQVTDMYVEHMDKNEFMKIIGAAENTSTHPLAKAIVTEVKKQGHPLPHATNVLSFPGYGVQASINGKKILIANPKYYKNNSILLPRKAKKMVKEWERQGKTVMIASINSRFSGIISIADEINKSSKTAVSRLKKMGFKVMMLTGDNRSNAASVAQNVGIKKQYAEITPQEKAEIIRQLQQQGNRVVMVGDGINDAPALTVAKVGIAIGTGSDVAIESGDITIVKSDVNRVADAIIISKKTTRNIKQNFLWAFLYNVLMIPIAMLGFLAPWLAGTAMAFSSVSVVLNSLRLKNMKI